MLTNAIGDVPATATLGQLRLWFDASASPTAHAHRNREVTDRYTIRRIVSESAVTGRLDSLRLPVTSLSIH